MFRVTGPRRRPATGRKCYRFAMVRVARLVGCLSMSFRNIPTAYRGRAAGERPLNACPTSHGEQALYRHPAVAEAGAFGVADPAEGRVPIAYVVFKPGQHATEAEIKRFLAGHRSPGSRSRILAIDQLPLTHSGKIDHAALAAHFASTRGT